MAEEDEIDSRRRDADGAEDEDAPTEYCAVQHETIGAHPKGCQQSPTTETGREEIQSKETHVEIQDDEAHRYTRSNERSDKRS